MTGKKLKQAESLACTKNRTRELNTLASSWISRHCTRSKLLATVVAVNFAVGKFSRYSRMK